MNSNHSTELHRYHEVCKKSDKIKSVTSIIEESFGVSSSRFGFMLHNGVSGCIFANESNGSIQALIDGVISDVPPINKFGGGVLLMESKKPKVWGSTAGDVVWDNKLLAKKRAPIAKINESKISDSGKKVKINEAADDASWDEDNFMKKALVAGGKADSYAPYHKLSDADQKKAASSYPSKSPGAKYDFKPEHYFYPTNNDGSLGNGDRSLAIPLAKIKDDDYMKGLGYEKRADWKDTNERKANESSKPGYKPKNVNEAAEDELVVHVPPYVEDPNDDGKKSDDDKIDKYLAQLKANATHGKSDRIKDGHTYRITKGSDDKMDLGVAKQYIQKMCPDCIVESSIPVKTNESADTIGTGSKVKVTGDRQQGKYEVELGKKKRKIPGFDDAELWNATITQLIENEYDYKIGDKVIVMKGSYDAKGTTDDFGAIEPFDDED